MKGTSELVKRSAVRRFLRKDLAEIDRLIEEDWLPVERIPGRNKPSIRIYLPAFHRWLLGYPHSAEMENYERFLMAFVHAQQKVP